MEKKGKLALIFLFGFVFAFALTGMVSASGADDFKKGIQIATTYATDYESGNINYAQLLVYLNSIEEDVNSVLRIMDDQEFTAEDITDFLGKPQETSWALSEGGANEVQLAEPVPAWVNKQIFDGKGIQLKISITPTLMDSGDIVYKASISTIIKRISSSFDLKEKISEIKILAETFYLDPTLVAANNLAEKTANLKILSETYFKQTNENCEDVLNNLLGPENKKISQKVITKTYEVYDDNENKVLAELAICDQCDEERIDLDIIFEKNGREVSYTLVRQTPKEYSELGINGIKLGLIDLNREMSVSLENDFLAEAYTLGEEIKILNQYWNDEIKKDPSSAGELPYIDMAQFYNGLFEGYPLIKTSYNNELVFEEVLFRKSKENQEEICYNKIDDNSNTLIDCDEATCSGQVCGTKIVTVEENGTSVEREIELYCIQGVCQEKENATKITLSVCGNSVCEEGETETCKKDCTICPAHGSLTCSGKVIFKGEDVNGCPLAPICVTDSNSCTTSSDCTQPLCGSSECIQGTCQLTKLELCRESSCTDGEQKIESCSNGQKIVSELCSRGLWKQTGEKCPETSITTEITAGVDPIKTTGSCTKQSECATGNVCSLGTCVLPPSNTISEETTISKTTVQAKSVTGSVTKITGDPITGTWASGVVPDADNPDVLGPVNEENVPRRTYDDGKKSFSSFTGIVRGEEANIQDYVVNEEDLLTGRFAGNRELQPEVEEEFILTATCTETSQDSTGEFVFTAAGRIFGAIAELTKSYEENGEEWATWNLEQELIKREELVKSFNTNFVAWFAEEYLPNNANSWSSAENSIIALYETAVDNQRQIAENMDKAGISELLSYDLIYIDYKSNSDILSLKYSEKVKDVQLDTTKGEVRIISPSMEAFIPAPEEFVKASLVNAMSSREFLGSRLSKAQRLSNKGLTDPEILKFKDNEDLKQKIRDITSDLGDGVLDVQFSVIDADNQENTQIIYNVYSRIDENNILIEPMPVESIPVVDVQITVPFEELYNIIDLSKETRAKTYTLYPDWEGGIHPGKSMKIVRGWIEMQLALNSIKSSIEVSPSTKQDEMRDLVMNLLFLMGGENN